MTGPVNISTIYRDAGHAAAMQVFDGSKKLPSDYTPVSDPSGSRTPITTQSADTQDLIARLTGIAQQTGVALAKIIDTAKSAALVDALTAVNPATMKIMDGAWQKYNQAGARLKEAQATGQFALAQRLQTQQSQAKTQILRAAEMDAAQRLKLVNTAANRQFAGAATISSQRAADLAQGESTPHSSEELDAAAQRLTVDMVVGVADLDALRTTYERAAAEAPGSSEEQRALAAYQARERSVLTVIERYEALTGEDASEGTGSDVAHMRKAGDELEKKGFSQIAERTYHAAVSSMMEMFEATDHMYQRIRDRRIKFLEEMSRLDRAAENRQRNENIRRERAIQLKELQESAARAWQQRVAGT